MARVIVVGGGPAGLMAADVISAAGPKVTLIEHMPSLGRKLLMAGRGGLNLTHSEPLARFLTRYGDAASWLQGAVEAFPPDAVRQFATTLGQETYVGSSGRVFPRAMKASPLLRGWIGKLSQQGVEVRRRHRLVGLTSGGRPLVAAPDGVTETLEADAAVLALGGASWPRLGSDGGWTGMLAALGIRVNPLAPANAGLEVAWSEHFRSRHAGAPLKRIAVTAGGVRVGGEIVVTATGLEGSPVYALNPIVRAELSQRGSARLTVDLRADADEQALATRLARPRGKQSTATWLRKSAGLSPAAIGLLREALRGAGPETATGLAGTIKALPLVATALGRLERAISTAGGVALDDVGPDMMLKRVPGLFVAGEMLDWDAPTGGYLLQACLATGSAAGHGALRYLATRSCPVAQVAGLPSVAANNC